MSYATIPVLIFLTILLLSGFVLIGDAFRRAIQEMRRAHESRSLISHGLHGFHGLNPCNPWLIQSSAHLNIAPIPGFNYSLD